MSPSDDYKFEYISPTILRAEDHAFLLFYSDALGRVEFGGYEPRHRSGGLIHVLSPEDWDELYPTRKGQRDLILQRLIEYSRAHPRFEFIERSLQKSQRAWPSFHVPEPFLSALAKLFAVTGSGTQPSARSIVLALVGLLLVVVLAAA